MKKIILQIICIFSLVTLAKTDVSLYENQSDWQDQSGKTIKLNHFKNDFVVITMVYTGCAHACPMTISKIKEIESYLKQEKIENYHMVLASFDIKNDTPEHLKQYMEERKLDPKHWSFLSTKAESIARELSVILGIAYKDLGNNDFSHSNMLTLLDTKGVVIHKVDNLNADLKSFSEKIKVSQSKVE
ncbi:MAG: SCO family protein [Bdellovibrionaceae bacterium]|nr:SCO family protein [Pseudobdellovibrionaceae bacterium]NUM59702.1 SCO family protein [Pseudobdellovibrionaceae bacterium]